MLLLLDDASLTLIERGCFELTGFSREFLFCFVVFLLEMFSDLSGDSDSLRITLRFECSTETYRVAAGFPLDFSLDFSFVGAAKADFFEVDTLLPLLLLRVSREVGTAITCSSSDSELQITFDADADERVERVYFCSCD